MQCCANPWSSPLRTLAQALALACCLAFAVATPAQDPTGLTATLDGPQAGTASMAAGWAFALLEANGQCRVTVDVDAPQATACELRHGAPGTAGALLLPLAGGGRTWTASALLAGADAQALLAGNVHVLLRTQAFPNGELRGQLVVPRSRRFQARLLPASLVPAAGWNLSGTVDLFLLEPDDRLVVSLASVTGARSVREYQLRLGPTGQNGPLLHTFSAVTSQGHGFGPSRRLSAAERQALAAGDVYLEATGEPALFVPLQSLARGQLLPPPWPWNGTLTGAEVVPPSSSPAQALAGCFPSNVTGTWVFWVDRHGFDEIACHVRRGPVGQNGPILFSLAPDSVKWLQQRVLTAAELAQLQNGEWYFERVTQALAQEVRAQIAPVPRDWSPSYGGGCPDGRGVGWHLLESHGVPAVGVHTYRLVRYELRLVGPGLLPPGGHGYLAVGFRRDRNGAVPLPQRLDGYGGAPSCYLLTEAAIVVAAQSGGTTWDQIWIPSHPALRGQSFFAQGVLFDPAAQGYFAVSNGLHVTLR